jgi:hypothetical protein
MIKLAGEPIKHACPLHSPGRSAGCHVCNGQGALPYPSWDVLKAYETYRRYVHQLTVLNSIVDNEERGWR